MRNEKSFHITLRRNHYLFTLKHQEHTLPSFANNLCAPTNDAFAYFARTSARRHVVSAPPFSKTATALIDSDGVERKEGELRDNVSRVCPPFLRSLTCNLRATDHAELRCTLKTPSS